ncbi:hypothetical protein Bbelb_054750 [Branchiostoma belcheri]|nr:hypothetical protein Bbelb_054750 [Branchiostoma belcheri]
MASVLKYSSGFLRACRAAARPLLPQQRSLLKTSGLLRFSSRPRGSKGGRNRIRQIQTVIGNRPPSSTQGISLLCKSAGEAHIPHEPKCGKQQQPEINRNLIRVPVEHKKQAERTQNFPSVYMCNARSLFNKLDEFELTIRQLRVDLAIVTETWFSTRMTSEVLNVEGYSLFSTSRTDQRGGGVAVYIREDIQARAIPQVTVPPDLECVWVRVRPTRLPRQVSSIVICATYIPPNSKHQDLLIEHLVTTTDMLRTLYPDVGLVFAGDYNRLDYKPLLLAHRLQQVVNSPTRGEATLDVVITNLKSYYNVPVVTNPIGNSDHNAVWWQPKVRPKTPNKTKDVLSSRIRALDHNWEEVLDETTVDGKTTAFYRTLHEAIDKFFPQKKARLHHKDKPWFTAALKNLIHKRQRAHSHGQWTLYRFLRNKIARDILRGKKTYYKDHIEHMKKTHPSEWHKSIRRVANWSAPSTTIHVPGVELHDRAGTADAVNKHLSAICQALSPLDCGDLPSYLPATPPPRVSIWDMYHRLRRIKVSKAPGPDNISPKLIKEFAFELSTPMTDILNSSLQEGKVPAQWKEAIVVPVPKELPADLDTRLFRVEHLVRTRRSAPNLICIYGTINLVICIYGKIPCSR